jgi:7-carboxy-7-deazaguanine synthase
MQRSLLITEIYKSVQGEAAYAGWPCSFVRLTGCPLRCRWCDTAYGFHGGKQQSFEAIFAELDRLGCPLVEITGGEPLAQEQTPALIAELIKLGYRVMIETSGSEPIASLHPETHIIMDLKCPDSGMEERNLYANLSHLKSTDEIKFVIASRKDFEWARDRVRGGDLDLHFQILFSSAFGLVKPADLVEWMLEERLHRVRLNLQQHKFIWNPRAKGV